MKIEEKIKKAIPKSNLTKNETYALKQLSQRDDIIITKADKGGEVVIIDVDDYIREANRQFNNTDFYKKIPHDPIESNRNKVNNTINEFKLLKLPDDTDTKNLRTLEARTPNFYMQPKIHKEGSPGRPFISSVNCRTTKISQYVDHHLQPHVQELGSYVKDSTNFIKQVSTIDKVPQESFLVTMDVCSLYTNIPNNERIKAVETTLKRKNLPTKVIISFVKLILTLNNFIFNFLQIKGCAMGTKCAPTYANIFMGIFEEIYIYPLIKQKMQLYLRYIDDIFFIWTGSENDLQQFISKINEVHPSIKFDFNYSETQIHLLDISITKTSPGKPLTTLYNKEIDRKSYLHQNSEHPETLKRSISYSQPLRLKRICTTVEDFTEQSKALTKRLIKIGYDENEIKQQISKTFTTEGAHLLNQKKQATSNRIPLILTYNGTLPDIERAVNKLWDILKINRDFEQVFAELPIIAVRRNRNLQDILGKKTIINNRKQLRQSTNQNGYSKPCNSKSNNLCCTHVQSTSTFRSTVTFKTFKIYNKFNCRSKYPIYLKECVLCDKQYTGKPETAFNLRLNNHRKDVNQRNSLQADQQF